jgi:predicted ATPase
MRTINEIKRIEIKGLFGFLNYDIELSGKGIDIITGPNGSGKTTILRLVMAVLEQDLEGLARPRYDSIIVHAGTEPYEMQSLKPRVRNATVTVLTEIKIQVENFRRIEEKRQPAHLRFTIDDIEVGSIYKRTRDAYEDEVTGEFIEERFTLDPPGQMQQKLGVFYAPQRVTVLNLSRMAAEGSQQIETSIEDEVSVDLSPINHLLRDSISRASQVLLDSVATSSQVLVDSLVTRKVPKAKNNNEANPLSEMSLAQIEHEFKRLKSQFITVGVRLDTSVLDSFFAGEATRRREYAVTDSEVSPIAERYVRTLVSGYQKAALHTERIYGFITQINAAMPRYKSIVVHFATSGTARVKVNQVNPTSGETIEISKGLSSGEHRLLKLYATLLLNSPTTFYFIDEPEISLHPSWIRELVTGLSSIRGTSQYFIASHSPTLVSKHKDLHKDLHMLLLNEGSNNNDHRGTEK